MNKIDPSQTFNELIKNAGLVVNVGHHLIIDFTEEKKKEITAASTPIEAIPLVEAPNVEEPINFDAPAIDTKPEEVIN